MLLNNFFFKNNQDKLFFQDYLIIFCSISFFFLWDIKLNIYENFTIALRELFYLLFIYLLFDYKKSYNQKLIKIFLFTSIFFVHICLSNFSYLTLLDFNYNLLPIGFLFLIFIICDFYIEEIIKNFSLIFIIFIYILIFSFFFSEIDNLSISEKTRLCGFFGFKIINNHILIEPSHLGMVLIPFYYYIFKLNKINSFNKIILLFFLSYIFLFFYSVTLLFSVITCFLLMLSIDHRFFFKHKIFFLCQFLIILIPIFKSSCVYKVGNVIVNLPNITNSNNYNNPISIIESINLNIVEKQNYNNPTSIIESINVNSIEKENNLLTNKIDEYLTTFQIKNVKPKKLLSSTYEEEKRKKELHNIIVFLKPLYVDFFKLLNKLASERNLIERNNSYNTNGIELNLVFITEDLIKVRRDIITAENELNIFKEADVNNIGNFEEVMLYVTNFSKRLLKIENQLNLLKEIHNNNYIKFITLKADDVVTINVDSINSVDEVDYHLEALLIKINRVRDVIFQKSLMVDQIDQGYDYGKNYLNIENLKSSILKNYSYELELIALSKILVKKRLFLETKNKSADEIIYLTRKNLQNLPLKNNKNINDHSSAVLLNAITVAYYSIKEKPFGWGFNNYQRAFNRYVLLNIVPKYPEIYYLNYNDGSNNSVKLIVEFGIFSLIIFINLLYFIFNKKIPTSQRVLFAGIILIQMMRAAGYFNGGFVLCVVFTFILNYKSFKKNEQ